MTKWWRPAATIILLRKGNAVDGNQLCTVMLKRSGSAKFMASATVFPGGVCDPVDFSHDWAPLLKKNWTRPDNKEPVSIACTGGVTYPTLYTENYRHVFGDKLKSCSEILPAWLALRLCAIRECFEETGILLVTSDAVNKVSRDSLSEWRRQVVANPRRFFDLCSQYSLTPDVDGLHEWSNWLTPVGDLFAGRYQRRFDTIFFVADIGSPSRLDHSPDNRESVTVVCEPPNYYLSEYARQRIWLAPPQLYELAKIHNCQNAAEVLRQRPTRSIVRIFPTLTLTNSGIVSVYPGDRGYPPEPDFVSNDEQSPAVPPFDGDFTAFRDAVSRTGPLNRCEWTGRFEFNLLSARGLHANGTTFDGPPSFSHHHFLTSSKL